ncbi:Zn-ribbon domain-containing OB-fold protein (plasmid) [Rhizobium leguminosarum]
MTLLINDTLSVARGPIRARSFSQAYWDATREKRLLIQRCTRTGQYQFFPRPVSIATGTSDLQWEEVDGRGELFSHTLTHRGNNALRGHEPYVVALVRLDVGVDVISNLVVTSMAQVKVGIRVKPYWLPLENGTHLLLFQPDEVA